MVFGALARNGSFGFAKGGFVCRAKPNVPFVRWFFPYYLFCFYAAKIPLSFCRLFCLFTMNANSFITHTKCVLYIKFKCITQPFVEVYLSKIITFLLIEKYFIL